MLSSSISRAKVEATKPRLLEVKSFYLPTEEIPFKQEEPNPEQLLQSKLDALNLEIEKQQQALEEAKALFQASIEEERLQFHTVLEEEKKDTIEKSFSDGFNQGEQAGFAAWEQKLAQANRIIEKAGNEANGYLDQAEPVILQLAIKVAEKIIGQTLDQQDEGWISLVKQAVKEMREESPIKIIVSPSRFEQTIQKLDEIRNMTHGSLLQIFVDEQLSGDDCYIESPAGRLDASVRTQLRQLDKELRQMMGLLG